MLFPDRFPTILATTVMGAYLLLVVGTTTSLTAATTSCGGWPACGGGYALPTDTAGWIALGHRLLAVLVGLLVVLSTALAWLGNTSRRVRFALTAGLLLFPVQAAMGALVAIGSLPASLSAAHLVVGVAIFASVLAALAWWLEAETGDPNDVPDGLDSLAHIPDLADNPDTGTTPLSAAADHQSADGSGTVHPSNVTGAGLSTGDNSSPGADRSPVTDPATTADSLALTATAPTDPISRLRVTAGAYFRLMKPRLMWLLCLVAAAAMALAGGPGFTPSTVAATLVGGSLAIGASGTFNHVLERDVDKRMQRTSDRPLATDVVPVTHAITFGLLLTAVSLGLFVTINPLTAGLGLLAIAFYSLVYTLILKPNTVQNTVIGGAAGALPALIGWAAVTGTIGSGGVLLALVIFLWTPAHFYNLALAYRDDYARGGFPMLPVVRGETTTRRHIVWYLGATFVAVAALAVIADPLGGLYATVGVVLGAVFLWAVIRLHYEQTESAAFRAFHASNAYLGLLLFAVVFDALLV